LKVLREFKKKFQDNIKINYQQMDYLLASEEKKFPKFNAKVNNFSYQIKKLFKKVPYFHKAGSYVKSMRLFIYFATKHESKNYIKKAILSEEFSHSEFKI
jgi:hypothetical protein